MTNSNLNLGQNSEVNLFLNPLAAQEAYQELLRKSKEVFFKGKSALEKELRELTDAITYIS